MLGTATIADGLAGGMAVMIVSDYSVHANWKISFDRKLDGYISYVDPATVMQIMN